MSVCPSAWNSSAPKRNIFMNFAIWVLFERMSRIFNFRCNLTSLTDTLHEDQWIFMIISLWILLRIGMCQTKVMEEIKPHIFLSVTSFRKSSCLQENVEKYGRVRHVTNDNSIRRMHIACWVTKATDTHSEYLILVHFPQQQWLRERNSIFHYTYTTIYIIYYNYYNVHDYEVKFCEIFSTKATPPDQCTLTAR
jgi:hypothetical protein